MKLKTLLISTAILLNSSPTFIQVSAQESRPSGTKDPFDGVIGKETTDKKIEELRNKPRFGMTEGELILLWGEPKDQKGYVTIDLLNGVKNQHKKYFQHCQLPGPNFRVDALNLAVWYYKEKACGITMISKQADKKINRDDLTNFAESLCKVKFAKLPRNAGAKYAVYSTDRAQSYMIQYQGIWCTVLHLPSWIQYRTEEEEKEKKASGIVDKL